jgi:murein L,D-transpeptidase YafK
MRYFLKNALIRVPAILVSFVLVALLCMTSHAIADSAEYADQIIVKKGERKLYLMRDGKVLKWYWIALGRSPVGSKIKIGDGRTPEGSYKITGRDRESQFYRALWLSYPNQADRQRAAELGVNPGAGIMIHALPEGYGPKGPGARMIDWTDGCIAVTNTDMDEIWSRVGDGIRVEILP